MQRISVVAKFATLQNENPTVAKFATVQQEGNRSIVRQIEYYSLDFEKHNAQYAPIEVEQFDRSHDRFLCLDDTVYLIGASLKDLGKKWFGFVKLEQTTDELLSKM